MAKQPTRHAVRRKRSQLGMGAVKPHFLEVAPRVMDDLIATFGLTPVQAAGVVGNLAVESQDFTAYHEGRQKENKGGYGWGQWTGPRRQEFFDWADSHGLQRDSEAASLGFLEYDLSRNYPHALTALKRQTKVGAATHRFMTSYERPGTPHEPWRLTRAAVALQVYNQKQAAKDAARK